MSANELSTRNRCQTQVSFNHFLMKESIVFNARFIIFDAEFIVFNARFIIFDAEFIEIDPHSKPGGFCG